MSKRSMWYLIIWIFAAISIYYFLANLFVHLWLYHFVGIN